MQLKTVGESLTVFKNIDNVLVSMSNYKGLDAKAETIKKLIDATRGYSLEATKMAISQSTLDKAQIKAILSTHNLEKEVKEATIAELTKVTADNRLTASQKKTTTSTTGLSMAMKGLGSEIKGFGSSALGLIKAHPIIAVLSVIATIVGTAIISVKQYQEEQKELIENAKALQEEYRNVTKTLSDNISSLESQKADFSKLAKGVDEFGNNISLSADEYDRYKSIVSEVLGYTPELISGYDAEGNAIANKNSLIERSIELMKEEQRQRLKEMTTDEKTGTIYKGAKAEWNDVDAGYEGSHTRNDIAAILRDNEKSSGFWATNDIIKALDLEKEFNDYYKRTQKNDLYSFTIDNIEAVAKAIKENKKALTDLTDKKGKNVFNEDQINSLIRKSVEWQEQYERWQRGIEDAKHGMDDQFSLYAQRANDYDKLTNAQKVFVNEYIKATGDIVDADGNLLSDDEIIKKAESYEDFVNKLATDPNFAVARDNINTLFSLDKTASASNYEKQVDAILKDLQKQLGLTDDKVKDFKVSLGFEFTSDGTTRTGELVQMVQDKLSDEFDDKVLELSLDDLVIASNLEVSPGTLLSWEKLIELINEAKGENANKTGILKNFEDIFNAESFKDSAKVLKELAISGELSPETFTTTRAYIDLLKETGLTAEEAIEKIRGISVAETSLSDIMGSLQSNAKLMNEVTSEISNSGQISFDTLQNIASKYPSLERYVTDYLNGVEGAQENLVSALSRLYNNELDNYREYYVLKQQYDNGWYTNYLENTSSWVSNLASKYGIDLKNYANYLETKAALEERINSLNTTNGKIGQATSDGKFHTDDYVANTSQFTNLKQKEDLTKILNDMVKEYENSIPDPTDLLDKFKDDDYTGGLTESTKSSDTYFDHIETRLDHFNDKLDEAKEKANDTFNGWSVRDNSFGEAIDQAKSLVDEYKEARARYEEEANKSGLDPTTIELVQKGAIQIDKLSNDDPLKEQIESYQKWYGKVKECDEAIKELDKDYLKWTNDSRKFRWEAFDYLEDSFSRITNEAKDLIDLLSNKDLFDDKGNLNEYGNATLALHASNIETYKQQAKDYLEEMKSLQKELENGGGQEVLEKYRERADAHREAILAMEQEKKVMLDLISEGYDKQFDTLNKLIDKKKELWDTEKSYNDYQKSIQEKTDNINSLKRQIMAYQGDNSEEAKSKLQKLSLELKEAEDDLEQTEYEKMISDSEKMLDQLLNDYQTFIDGRLGNSDSLLQQIVDSLSANGEISKTLKELADSYGLNISDTLISSATGNTNAAINGLVNNILSLLGGNASLLGNVGGYANGTLSATKGLHRFNEKGNEIIIRKSDGSMLRNFDQGDVVISNEGAKLLSKFAENPALFMEKFGVPNVTPVMPNVTLPKMPVMQGKENLNNSIGDVHVNIELPNVHSYEDFMTKAQNDSRFEGMIQHIAFSKNPMDKYKYKWK